MSVTTISPQQLAELCKSGKIDLIDVRTPVEFREVARRRRPQRAPGPARPRGGDAGPQRHRGRAAVPHLPLREPGPAGVREVPGRRLHQRRQRRGRHAGLGAKPACRSSVARRRSRWSGRCALRRGRWCCWACCSAGSSIRPSSACRPSSGPGWSSPASPTPAAWACCWPGCRGTRSRTPRPRAVRRRRSAHETAHRRRRGRRCLGSRPCPSPVGRRPDRPVRAGAGRVVRQLRPALLPRRRDRRAGQAARRHAGAAADPLQARRAGADVGGGHRPRGEEGPCP